ncbi:MAG TPA: VgrG-related protein [Trebonia sp.]|jgi:phage protein D/phage baseplate assembly protein gpV
MEPTVSNLQKVKLNDIELPNQLAATLGETWVEFGVNLPAAFHITLRASAEELMKAYEGDLQIGAKATIFAVADQQGKDTPIITGVVTGIETEWTNGLPRTVVRGFDNSFKMLRQRRAKGYQHMTASAIVTELAGLDGVQIGEIQSTTVPYTSIIQPNVSDWEFVQYLAAQNNMEADFDNLGLLRFRKPSPAGELVMLDFKQDVQYCRTGITAADQVSKVTTRGWNADTKQSLTGLAPATTSTAYEIGKIPGEVTGTLGTATITETGTPYGSQPEVDAAASSLAADITSAFAEMEMQVTGWPALVPGAKIALDGAGKPFDGTYTITTTRHVFDAHNFYTTWISVTGRQVRTLYGLAASGQAQPKPRIPGVVNAIVTDNNDPMKQGRVKLKYPWFTDQKFQTDWVRTVQLGGYTPPGKVGGGGVIGPEVDDEVLVAFDRGSMDLPYVIGGLYSTEHDKPLDLAEEDVPLTSEGVGVTRRTLASRTGQRIDLLDSTTKQKTGVRLSSGDNKLTVFLNQDATQKKIEVTNEIEEGKIEISSTGAGNSITIDATGSGATISVNATGPVSVKSSQSVTVDAPTINVNGSTVNINAATTTIRGDVAIMGMLTQAGLATFGGEITVAGSAEFAGAVTIEGEETVVGARFGSPVVPIP